MTKARYQLYLEPELSQRLEDLATKNGNCKSAILTDALRAYLNRRGAKELDDLLGTRLGRLERGQEVVLESLAIFIRYYLTVTAPLPESDKAAIALGNERFGKFINQLVRHLAEGKGMNYDTLMRKGMDEAA